MVKIKIKKLNKEVKLPNYAYDGDAGLDVYAIEDIVLAPGERKIVKTGISSEIPKGYAFFVWDKSGIAIKNGIKTMGGVIDSGYRGEWQIILLNISQRPYKIKKGEKIAQLVLQKVERAMIKEVKNLGKSERGKRGFGSSGR